MNEKNDKKSKEDWFKRLEKPLKSINIQYKKLILNKKELSKNQRILNEYNINDPQRILRRKNNLLYNDDKVLLNRINIDNYKNLDRENIIIKKILSKIEERSKKNLSLKLRRFKTNKELEIINSSSISNKNIIGNIKIKKLNLHNNNHLLNTPSITDRNKNEKPLKLILSKKINLSIENSNNENNYFSSIKRNNNKYYNNNYYNIINNVEENDKNFFKTLTRVDRFQNNIHKKSFKRIENAYEMMKLIRDEEEYGNILNKKILFIKKSNKKLKSINLIKKNKNSLNFTKIKNIKDIERKIINSPPVNIFEYLKKNFKQKSQILKGLNNNDEVKIE